VPVDTDESATVVRQRHVAGDQCVRRLRGGHGHGKVVATANFTTGEITISADGEVERDE
jgi:hypothetical protein